MAAQRTLAYRIGIEGKEGVIAAQREIGDAGDAAWKRASGAAERYAQQATASAEKARQAAVAAAQAQPSAVAQRINQVTGVTGLENKSARDSAAALTLAFEDQERRARQLKGAIDPLWAAEERLARETANADQLLRRGAISQAEHTAALGLARGQYAQTEAAVKRMGKAHGLAANDINNLIFQANDLVVSLASGQRPLTVLLQQGSQVGQIFSTRPGAAAWALRLFRNEAVLAGGAAGLLATATLAGVLAADAYATRQAKLATALRFTATAANVNVAEFEDLARTQSKAAEITRAAARDTELSLLTIGHASKTQLPEAILLSKKLSIALGVDLKAAAGDVATALADPARGAEALNDKLHFLTATQVEHIRQLELQGDRTAAADYVLKQLDHTVGGAEEHLGILKGTIHNVALAFDGAASSTGGFLAKLLGLPAADAAGRLAQANSRLAQLDRQEEKLKTPFQSAQRAKFLKDAADARVDLKAANDASAEAARSINSQKLRTAFDALSPTDGQIKAIQDRQAQLRAAQKDAKALKDAGLTPASASAAISQGDAEIKQLRERAAHRDKHAESLARDSAALEVNASAALDVARAYLVSDADGALAEARRKALTEATRKGVDAEARARRQVAIAVGEEAIQGAKATLALETRAAAQDRVNDLVARGLLTSDQAQQQLQAQLSLGPLIEARDKASGEAKALLTDEIDRQTRAYARLTAAEARSALQAGGQASADRIAQLKLEAAYAGDLTGQRERVAAALKVTQSPAYQNATDGRARQIAVIEAVTEADEERFTRQRQYFAETARSQAEELELAQADLALVGRSAAAHERVLGKLRLAQDLKRQGFDLSSAEAQVILQQADNVDAVNRRLQYANDNFREFQATGERIVDDILNPANWHHWGDVGKAVLRDLEADLLRLAVINPLKNALFGSELPTTAGFGGFLKQLLNGGAKAPLAIPTGAPGDDALGLGKVLDASGGRFVTDFDRVFAENTSGGFLAVFGDLLASAGGSGGGGGGGDFLASLFKIGVKVVAAGSGGGASGGATLSPGSVDGFAAGTDSAPGGLAYVHKGELLANLSKGSQVFTAAETRRLLSGVGTGRSVHVEINMPIFAQGAGPREIDSLQGQLTELRQNLPNIVVAAVNDGISRGRVAA